MNNNLNPDSILDLITRSIFSDDDIASYLNHVCSISSLYNSTGDNALHIAATCGRKELMKWLIISKLIDVNVQGAVIPDSADDLRLLPENKTALMKSLFYGYINCAVCLMKLGATLHPMNFRFLNTSKANQDFERSNISMDSYLRLSPEEIMLNEIFSLCDDTLSRRISHRGLTPFNYYSFPGVSQKDSNSDESSDDGKKTSSNKCSNEENNICDSEKRSGEVYVFGSNKNYTIGSKESKSPQLLKSFHHNYPKLKVTSIYLDKYHTVLITNNGKIFSSGHGRGGRLGHSNEKSSIDFKEMETPKIPFKSASIGRDHSVLLSNRGEVYTCGLNKYYVLGLYPPPKQVLQPKIVEMLRRHRILGVKAARFHTIVWTGKKIWSWGLNGGQLGHNRTGDKFFIAPQLVKLKFEDDVFIKCVGSSIAATALATSSGDIFLFHEYKNKKIISGIFEIEEITVIGGNLNNLSEEEIQEEDIRDLKIAFLTKDGRVLFWQESMVLLAKCSFQEIEFDFKITQINLNVNELLFITAHGQAFRSKINPIKKKVEKLASCKKKDLQQLKSEILFKTEVYQIPNIYAGMFICSDPVGENFAILQDNPLKYTNMFKEITPSTFLADIELLLSEETEVYDVTFEICGKKFHAHKYFVAEASNYLKKLIDSEKDPIVFDDINPLIFSQILKFIYLKTTDLQNFNRNELSTLCTPLHYDFNPIDKETVLKHQKIIKKLQSKPDYADPVVLLREAAKKLEITELEKFLENLFIVNDMLYSTGKITKDLILKENNFDHNKYPEYWDVEIKTKDGCTMGAHKCILYARCEYFRNMFACRWSEANQIEKVNIDYTSGVVKIFLNFIYTDDTSLIIIQEVNTLCRLLVLSDQYLLPSLTEICEKVLSEYLNLKNSMQVIFFARTYNAIRLKHFCYEFVCKNLQTFLENRMLENADEEVLNEITEYYRTMNFIPEQTTNGIPNNFEEIIDIISKHYIKIDMYDLKEFSEGVLKKNKTSRRRTRSLRKSTSESTEKNLKLPNDVSESRENFQINEQKQFENEELKGFSSISKTKKRVTAIKNAQNNLSFESLPSDFTKLKVVEGNESSFQSPSCSSVWGDKADSLNQVQDFKIEEQGINSFSEEGKTDINYSSKSSEEFPELGGFSRKSLTPQKSIQFHGKGEVRPKLSQKQRKRLNSQASVESESSLSKSAENPWKINEYTPNISMQKQIDFNEILHEEKKQRENFTKMKSKLLMYTLMEDKALDELYRFYNSANIFDEIITVERVQTLRISDPIWVQKTKS